MTLEDFKVLEKYYPKMHSFVINQAVSCLALELKGEILDILKRNGRGAGLCSHCNSALLGIATQACRLYVENKDKFNEQENAETKEQKAKGRRTRKRV